MVTEQLCAVVEEYAASSRDLKYGRDSLSEQGMMHAMVESAQEEAAQGDYLPLMWQVVVGRNIGMGGARL